MNINEFFKNIKETLFDGKMNQEQVDNINLILKESEGIGYKQLAYIFATIYHETNRTMKPIKEYGGNNYFFKKYDIKGDNPSLAKSLGNIQDGDGIKFCGRGFCQITGRNNYKKFSDILKVDLINNPELALDVKNACDIIIYGMKNGTFTGKKLSDYINDKTTDYVNARRIINGTDKAVLISQYAMKFEKALV